METIGVTWQGTSNLIVQRPIHEEDSGKVKKPKDPPPEEKLYTREGKYVFPNRNILFCIRDGASRKIERGRTTYKSTILGLVQIPEIWVPLLDSTGKPYGLGTFQLFERFIKRGNGERIWSVSPMFETWQLRFDLVVDESIVPVKVVKAIMDIAGTMSGFGAARQLGFGRFTVKLT